MTQKLNIFWGTGNKYGLIYFCFGLVGQFEKLLNTFQSPDM